MNFITKNWNGLRQLLGGATKLLKDPKNGKKLTINQKKEKETIY